MTSGSRWWTRAIAVAIATGATVSVLLVSVGGFPTGASAEVELPPGPPPPPPGLIPGSDDLPLDEKLRETVGSTPAQDLLDAYDQASGNSGGDETSDEDENDDPPPPPPPEPTSTSSTTSTTQPVTAPVETETDAEEEAEEPVPPRLWAQFDALRALDGGSIVLPPVVLVSDVFPIIPSPFGGYVDVPAGPRSTREIVDLLVQAGITGQDMANVLAPFPVAGPARYSNDWGAPRYTPFPHRHEGTDIFASQGTPVVASFDGVVAAVGIDTTVGGNSVKVVQPDGTYTYYAHLDGFSPIAVEGLAVTAGTVIGYVGSTGNAVGGPPHLHYEIHPGGGDPVPPLPYLDLWLQAAREKALRLARGVSPTGVGAPFPVPQAANLPSLAPFQPAASSGDESPVPGLAMLAAFGLVFWVIRRRDRFAVPLRALQTWVRARIPARLRSRPGVPATRLLHFPIEEGLAASRDGDRVVDVLEPFLSRRAERERVGSSI